jgi:hypothetical protein
MSTIKRIQKALLLTLRRVACRSNCLPLYYWSDLKLYGLRTVCVMPGWYYRWLYHTCMRLADFNRFSRLADRAIHTIPLSVRFAVA